MRPRKTILCVEDNEQLLGIRKFLLETRGYRVVAKGCAAEALEFLNGAAPGTVDLLMSDLIMPAMDGNELIRRAKQMHPGLPTLAGVGDGDELRSGGGGGRVSAEGRLLAGGGAGPDTNPCGAEAGTEEAGAVGGGFRGDGAGGGG